jgi:IS30 family transposase
MSHITILERKKLYEKRLLGISFYAIAKELRRPTKTIINEFKRNKVARHGYEPMRAQEQVMKRRSRPRNLYKFSDPSVREFVTKALKDDISPMQISGRLLMETGFKLSPEAIYLFVYRDKREGGKLFKHLRRHHRKRRHRMPRAIRVRIKNSVSIEKRPKIVEAKIRFGDLELDTMEGKRGSGFFVTAVDRATKKLWASYIPTKTAANTRDAILKMLAGIKVNTMTSDNGSEFACHEVVAQELEALFFFAHPYSSYERGLNEHTNGLLRQYFPKGTEFYGEDIEAKLQEAVNRINRRPRKVLKFKTPDEVFAELIRIE